MRPTNDSTILHDYWAHGKSADCPVFNTHAHYGPYGAIYFPGQGKAEAMIRSMDRAGVGLAVMSSHAALRDPIEGNEVTAGAVSQYPDRFRGYVVVNPNYPQQAAEDIFNYARWQERRFVGFKIHPSGHQYPLSGPNYQPMFEIAEAEGIPVLSHTWGKDPYCGSAQVRAVVQKYPRLYFLAGHTIHGEWDEAVAIANDHSNVYLELTAAYSVSGLLEHLVAGVGAERILFGDDLPWFDPMHAIGCILGAHISDDARRLILYGNAERLFGLKCPAP